MNGVAAYASGRLNAWPTKRLIRGPAVGFAANPVSPSDNVGLSFAYTFGRVVALIGFYYLVLRIHSNLEVAIIIKASGWNIEWPKINGRTCCQSRGRQIHQDRKSVV